MKHLKILAASLLLMISASATAQQNFIIVMSPADSLREAGNLKEALKEFRKAYVEDPLNQANLYNFACAFAVSNQKDSAFKYLNAATRLDTSISVLTDVDFVSMHKDTRWSAIEDKVLTMVAAKNNKPYKDKEYTKMLLRMKARDQAYYSEIKDAEEKIGKYSTTVNALWQMKEHLNIDNQKTLELLIKQKGWPKISEVGGSAASAAFLVIQHSDMEKQKKYLLIIEQLCKTKEANWESFALMYDRIQVSENKPQKYGSQIRFNDSVQQYELFPLLDESKVEEWRAAIGMQPLADYVARWNIKFEPKK
jgi:tetratricopeptide (TPR) repeat protein